MAKFRKLEADEIECRVARVAAKSDRLELLLYKTARTDAAILDETVGGSNWQCDFKSIDGKLFCGIGIRTNDSNEWVWRWDCGSEGMIEPEKSLASDAFKRAGFKFGIGVELYSAPRIIVYSDKANIRDGKCYDRFRVQTVGYDENGRINRLKIFNESARCVCYDWTA